MTLATLGYRSLLRVERRVGPKEIDPDQITVVIPVKDDSRGVLRALRALTNLSQSAQPASVIVVDNNSATPVTVPQSMLPPVELLTCARRGPAAARNVGWRAATTPWILFLDADCIPTSQTIAGFCAAANGALAYAGDVRALDRGPLPSFYEAQKTLIPPPTDERRPEYLVTANALVWRPILQRLDGFDESFDEAGGEDIDLGLRIRAFGDLSFAPLSVVLHEFGNDPLRFIRRFSRYGRGNRQLERLHGGQMRPRPFAPAMRSPLHWTCAALQYMAMTWGYFSSSRTRRASA